MLDERKASILRAVVEAYIQTSQPVGSGHVAAVPGVAVSPATVRNDMAALEAEGYLHQPHTSAGRVPTDAGYRYFVDNLGGPTVLDRHDAAQVRDFFDRASGEIEQMLADTSKLLSTLTDTAAVVVGPTAEGGTVRSVQVVGLSERVVLLVAVLSNGAVEKWTVELSEPATEAALAAAGTHLSARLSGRHLRELPIVEETGDPGVDAVLRAVGAALGDRRHDPDTDQVFVGGTARMAGAFEAVDTVRQVLSILESQLVVVTVLRDVVDRGLQVAIGTETGLEPLAECSVVVAPYEVEGESTGTIGVLGPTRMNYPQALAAVAVVGNRLGRRLSEG